MKKDDCVELGYINKAHGLKGEVKLVLDVYDTAEYEAVRTFYLAKKEEPLHKIFVKALKPGPGKFFLASIRNINTRNDAEALVGSTIYFPKERLPKLAEGQFYYYQVVGFKVWDEIEGELGTVREVLEMGASDVLVMDYKDKEVLIPMNEAVVIRADLEQEKMITHLPEGLLSLYLGEE